MDNRGLFKEVFGKDRGITEDDIREKIIKIGYKESGSFECKTFQQIAKIDNGIKEDKIIAPLVAFLNKFITEGGILVLGIDCKDKTPSKIIAVDDKLIKNESQLRSWIIGNISSLPFYYTAPIIEIEEIPITKNQKVFVIEIHPADGNVVYFSKISDYAYRRVCDETLKIPLMETLKLIEEKRMPRMKVNVEPKKWQEKEGIIEGSIKVVYNNLGNRPAYRMISLFMFKLCEGTDKNITICNSRFNDITHLNTGFIKVLQYRDLDYIFYPNCPTVAGSIEISFNKDIKLELIIETNEEMSYSEGVFVLSSEGIKEKSPPSFKTYI